MIIREAKISYKKIGEIQEGCLSNEELAVKAAKMHLENLDPDKEHFCVIALNRKNKIKSINTVTTGTLTESLVHPREAFRPLIMQAASAFICFHNHPSGDPAPSRADIQVTRQLRESAKIIGIDFLDHIIIGEKEEDPRGLGYYSFNDAGLI
jgi:DNA repair protein RadC